MKRTTILILAALLIAATITSCSSLKSTTAVVKLEDPDYPYLLVTEEGAVSANERTIGEYMTKLNGVLTIPDTLCGITVKSVAAEGFYLHPSIREVILPDSVTSIGSSAFKDCSNLKAFTAGSGLESIGSSAFKNCYELSSVSLNIGLKKIGGSAFYNCSKLTYVDIPYTVESVGAKIFYGLTSDATIIAKTNSGYDMDWKGSEDITVNTKARYRVSFLLNGGVGDTVRISAENGDLVTIPAAPQRDGYTFAGWILEGSGTLYQPGDTYILSQGATTFLATWK